MKKFSSLISFHVPAIIYYTLRIVLDTLIFYINIPTVQLFGIKKSLSNIFIYNYLPCIMAKYLMLVYDLVYDKQKI